MKRILTFALLLVLAATAALAQRAGQAAATPQRSLDTIESLLKKGHYQSAYSQARALRDRLLASPTAAMPDSARSRGLLLSTQYMSEAGQYFLEDCGDSATRFFRAILPHLTRVDRTLCHLYLSQPDSALSDTAWLKGVPVTAALPLAQKPEGAAWNETPTLYDLVMVHLRDQGLASPSPLRLQQALVAHYKALPHSRQRDHLLLNAELKLASLLNAQPNTPDSLKRARLERCLRTYRTADTKLVGQCLYALAQLLYEQGDRVAALAYCDSTLLLYPHTGAANQSFHLRESITQKDFSARLIGDSQAEWEPALMAAGRDVMVRLEARNVERLYFSVVAAHFEGRTDYRSMADTVLKHKPLHQWDVALPHPQDYRSHSFYTYVPALPAGDYLLAVTDQPKLSKGNFVAYAFSTENLACMPIAAGGEVAAYLSDYASGAPLAGHAMQATRTPLGGKVRPPAVHADLTTDSHGVALIGRSTFAQPASEDSYCTYQLSTTYQGHRSTFDLYYHGGEQRTGDTLGVSTLFTDRPIYRPGDTVHFAFVATAIARRTQGFTPQLKGLLATLSDFNLREVGQQQVDLDAYGSASGFFVIPAQATPGNYLLAVNHGEAGTALQTKRTSKIIRVEAYKQPKFMVTLHTADRRDPQGRSLSPAFGDTLEVEGLAAAYSQAPLSGARVRYRVEREVLRPWWRRWVYGNRHFAPTVVATDSLTADAEGHFRIAFVPWPDSAIELSTKPNFTYTLYADVTDLNGETHSQQLRLNVGYENAFIQIDAPQSTADLSHFSFTYQDLNRTPLAGQVNVVVEQVKDPSHPYLAYSEAGVRHTISEAEFARRFPFVSYAPATEAKDLPVARHVYATTLQTDGKPSHRVSLPRLGPGTYRISVSCGEVAQQAVVAHLPYGTRQMVGNSLLWADVDRAEAQVGDTVVARVGSSLKGVYVTCLVEAHDSIILRQTLLADGKLHTLRIPVGGSMLGSFNVEFFAVKEGHRATQHFEVAVPYVHQALEITASTFRNKLEPGEKESWSLHIRPADSTRASKEVRANLLLTMYDAALNTYATLDYNRWNPWNAFGQRREWAWQRPSHPYHSPSYHYIERPSHTYRFSQSPTLPYTLRNAWGFGSLRPKTLRMNKAYATSARGEAALADNLMASKSTRLAVVEEEVAEVEEVFMMVEADEAPADRGEEPEQKALRTNQSTLAFFEPTLRSHPDGSVTYSFVAPDLLTEWDIEGVAWTRDLRIGHWQKSLVTQKELMVQPNMPRFLRQGDTATLMAKVTNLTEREMSVCVDFAFDIPATEGRPASQQRQSRTVAVAAGQSVAVAFEVEVPVGGTVATYRFYADEGHFSDGEQGPLPLLTNRQGVTHSLAMFAHERGEKTYQMALPQSPTAQPVSLTVEYTGNPLWLAVQTLPYFAQRQNPSNLYLFNSLYANSLGHCIAQQNPFLRHCADNASLQSSPLFRNEEVRQTLIEETPWLGEGQAEMERLQALANYYDTAQLQAGLQKAYGQLMEGGCPDGGWSWMPEGEKGNLYVTQYILKGFAQLAQQLPDYSAALRDRTAHGVRLTRAMHFVDQAHYEDYQREMEYSKKHPNSTFQPIHLDYLYTSSFYPGRKSESRYQKAYDFYYKNAKQNHRLYTSLSQQALLALVFHRHGDHKLAKEMIKLIKERSLVSEEMGMYWRDNVPGYFFHQRPIETQALLIAAFREVTPEDTTSVALMQQWLLRQKQTTTWASDIATLHAIQALTAGQTQPVGDLSTSTPVTLRVESDTFATPALGEGYIRHTYRGDTLAKMMQTLDGAPLSIATQRMDATPSWGAAYYLYTEQMDKVPALETGIKMTRQCFRVNTDGTLTELTPGGEVQPKVGDLLRLTLNVDCDRTLEYVEMKNPRAACLEPVNTSSGWRWSEGVGYYTAVGNSHDAIYIDRLDKGRYTIESDYYVTNPGSYTLAPTVLQCLYAPEFRSTSSGTRMTVAEQ